MKYDRDYMLTFGRHKGNTLEYVSRIDPSYIIWLSENVLKGMDNDIVQEAADDVEYFDDVLLELLHDDWGDRE